jgi:hypothetical protein
MSRSEIVGTTPDNGQSDCDQLCDRSHRPDWFRLRRRRFIRRDPAGRFARQTVAAKKLPARNHSDDFVVVDDGQMSALERLHQPHDFVNAPLHHG